MISSTMMKVAVSPTYLARVYGKRMLWEKRMNEDISSAFRPFKRQASSAV